MTSPVAEDIWAQWLSFRRQGSTTISRDQEHQLQTLRDRVLGLAAIKPDDTVLDVGCGDGLIAFGALERLGSKGQLVFADLSADLITRCRLAAQQLKAEDRCRFLVCPADALQVDTASVDVLTTRSVLIYVSGKDRAMAEAYRVLRPGGRAVIAEPINRYSFPEPPGTFLGYDVRPINEIAGKLIRLYDQEATPAIAPMLDFDERDLV
ncbi:MAG: methyltransferase domain-containing protein, partial [Candidatus Dormibacteraeota bacterium]|nr:methyltransferase domain-containing protein [Candidatus Dormibacteraeota bacterium]